VNLLKAGSVTVKRHIKIRAEATPYDPRFTEYFEKRERYSAMSNARSKQASLTKIAPNDTG